MWLGAEWKCLADCYSGCVQNVVLRAQPIDANKWLKAVAIHCVVTSHLYILRCKGFPCGSFLAVVCVRHFSRSCIKYIRGCATWSSDILLLIGSHTAKPKNVNYGLLTARNRCLCAWRFSRQKIYIPQKIVSWLLFSVCVFAIACEPVWSSFKEVPTLPPLPSLTYEAMFCVQLFFCPSASSNGNASLLESFCSTFSVSELGSPSSCDLQDLQANKREKKTIWRRKTMKRGNDVILWDEIRALSFAQKIVLFLSFRANRLIDWLTWFTYTSSQTGFGLGEWFESWLSD